MELRELGVKQEKMELPELRVQQDRLGLPFKPVGDELHEQRLQDVQVKLIKMSR